MNAAAVLLVAFVSITATFITGTGGFEFNCDQIATPKCFCESKSGGGQHGLELLCPNSLLAEVHNVTLILNSGQYDPNANANTDGQNSTAAAARHDINLIQVAVKCNPYEPGKEMQWELLEGLNLGGGEDGKYWYKLKLSLCPILTSENLDNFLTSISLPKNRLVGFSFEPPQDKSTGLPISKTNILFSFLRNLDALEVLEIKRSNLVRIPDGAFAKLGRLHELHLKENQLVFLNASDFSGNTHLKLLDLSFNSIQNLHDARFPGSLELLDLSSNKLEEVGQEAFSGLGNLRILTLRQNPQLKTIHYNAFDELANLTTLDLVYTGFSALPRFDGLQHLENLYISYLDNNPTIFLAHSQTNTTIYGDKAKTTELSTVFTADYTKAFANLSSSMQTLQLISDGLIRIPEFGTTVLKNLSILNLSANQITTIPMDAFAKLPALTQLDLSLNQIVQFEGFGAPNLKTLTMSHNFVRHLGRSVFKGLGRLETLRMSNNMIETIEPRAFEYLTALLELDLSSNKLEHLSTSSNPSGPTAGEGGPHFSVDGQHAEASFLLDTFEQSYFRFSTKLQTLNLAKNRIPMIYDDWKNLFLRLKSLDLSYNGLTALHANDINFVSIAQMLSLDLRSNNISTVEMEHAALFLDESDKRNTAVKLNDNPLDCDCRMLAFLKFNVKGVHFDTSDLRCAAPPALTGTLFKLVQAEQLICPFHPMPGGGPDAGCPPSCECWRIPFNQTITIDCSFRRFQNFIPSVQTLRIPRGYKLVLNLSGNGYTFLNASHAQNISSSVVRIDLSKNELDSLEFLKVFVAADDDNQNSNELEPSSTTPPVSPAINRTTASTPTIAVSLSQNRFSCEDCEFHKLMKKYFQQISDYNEITCIAPSGVNGTAVRHVVSNDQLALETEYCSYLYDNGLASYALVLAILSGLLLVFTALLIVVYLRHGWAIRAFLYSKGFGSCFFISDDEEEYEKVYDAFVSYSHKDEEWVISQLVKRLEDEEGFKLCLHYRDWTAGDWIPDQIVQSVDKSRRTVIILSKNFVESVWSRLEFKAAHSQALNEKTNRLILILIGEDLSETDIYDDDLRMYMKMNTYLKWSDPWLWHKLKFALPHKKKAPVGDERGFTAKVQHERAIQLDKLRSKMEEQVPKVHPPQVAVAVT